MPLFTEGSAFLKEKEKLNLLRKITRGKVAFMTSLNYERKDYPISFGILEGNFTLGYDFFFTSQASPYTLRALSDVSYEDFEFTTLRTNNPHELSDHLEQSLKNSLAVAESFLLFQRLYSLTRKLNCALLGTAGSVNMQFDIALKNKETRDDARKMVDFFKAKGLYESLFPIKKEIFALDFSSLESKELDTFATAALFMKRFVHLVPNFRKSLLEKDAVFTRYMLESISVKLPFLVEGVKKALQILSEELEYALGKDGILDNIVTLMQSTAKNANVFRALYMSAQDVFNYFNKSILPKVQEISPNLYKDIEKSMSRFDFKSTENRAGANNNQGVSDSSNSSSVQLPPAFHNTVTQILEYAKLEPTTRKNFDTLYNKWKLLPEKLSREDDARILRKRITEIFWEIYANAFVNYKIHKKPMTKPIELMFHYCFFDETLLSPHIIGALLKEKPLYNDERLKIYNTFEWLNAIADKQVEPSLDATGEGYMGFIKDKQRDKAFAKKSIDELDTPEERIRYEVRNMVKEASKISHGELSSYTPILLDEQFYDLDAVPSQIISKSQISQALFALRVIDYSVFFREVLHREAKFEEFVKEEVLPILILLPNSGKRGMVWQAKERAKNTSARFTLSAIQTGEIKNVMMSLFGIYRWEIVKELLGPLWNDLTQLSLTAEYTDYVSTIKKNKELSEEAKEKVMSEFKRYRNDRDRFVNDYMRWIAIESQGRPGVNKSVRSILYRQVPFNKEIREKLSKMPAFADINQRYLNIKRKEFMRLKTKYQKYLKNENDKLPVPLQDYLNFFQL